MDEKDFEILKILDKNCRTSYANIARALSLTVRTVSRRVGLMLERGVIKNFSVQFNYNLLGFRHHIGSTYPSQEMKHKDLFKVLQKVPEIIRVWELIDGSLTFRFFSRDPMHLENILNKIINLGIKIRGHEETRTHIPFDISFSLIDWRIIFILFKNSRATQSEIAFTLDVSEKTIMRRLKRMENMRLIQFTPEINFEAISGMVSGIVPIETIGTSKNMYFKIKKDKSIKYWRNAGSVLPSIVLFLYGQSLTEIYEMYLRLNSYPEVKNCSLVFVVKNWENSTIIEDSILEKIQQS